MKKYITEENNTRIEGLKEKESILVNYGTGKVMARVCRVVDDRMTIRLKEPICIEIGAKLSLNRLYIGNKFMLIGWAEVISGVEAEIYE